MKIRTESQFIQAVADEIAWRKKELAYLKAAVKRDQRTLNESTSVRAAIAMLYAHWEGFIKAAGRLYVAYVAKRRFRYAELAQAFQAMRLREVVARPGFGSIQDCLDLCNLLETGASERPRLDAEQVVQTHSNLNGAVLRQLVLGLGLDWAPYGSKVNLIDEQLVAKRNTIAHGSFLDADAVSYVALHDQVLSLLELFRSQVENAVVTRSYRRMP